MTMGWDSTRRAGCGTALRVWWGCRSGPTPSAPSSPSRAPPVGARLLRYEPVPRPTRSNEMLRILLADDHKILREGIRRGLEGAGEEVVGEASNGEEAVELARAPKADGILMDLSMPVLDGIGATKRIVEEQPDTKIVVLTMHDDAQRTRAAIS